MPPLRSILLFGAPGTGKGTQGKLLAQVPGFHHVATGDLFRALDKSSALGKQFADLSARGELVPDGLTVELFRQSMEQRERDGRYLPRAQLLLLDGIPRSAGQATALAGMIEVLGVLHLICPNEDEMVQRMRRRALREGRTDDADERVIRRRFDVYRAETRPVLDCFPASLVHEIGAVGSPATVLTRVLAAAAPLLDASFPNPLD